MRIAIVGTGVAGLVAAHRLHPEHEITVYEAGERLGGHSHTVHVDGEDGGHWIDTGFIVFNDRNYPNFERLLEQLEVPSQPSHMSFSVSDGRGGFEYSGTPWGLFARPSHLVSPSFLGMLRDWRRFNREARELIGMNGTAPSLGHWLEQKGFSRHFVERLIVPQAAAVWSADPEQMWSFPASFMAEFFENHGMFGLRDRPRWRTVSGGSRSYVEAISEPWRDRVRLRAPVRRVERFPDRVRIEADGCESEDFDEVVIAAHSDQALALLSDPSEAELEILGAIPYQRNEAVLHTDASLLPRRRAAWSSWNFHLGEEPPGRSTVTYWMNHLQRLRADQEYLLTLNRAEAIDPAKVLRRFSYDHPVYTAEGVAAQAKHAEISGVRRTHYCGAYWGWGFHEDGVVSALRACDAITPRRTPARGVSELTAPIDPRQLRHVGWEAGGMSASSASAVYEGWVRHRRFEPVEHSFRYRLFLMYLDLGELPAVLDPYPLFSARRPAPARFRRADFMGDPERPLAECARDAAEAETGSRPAGPVRLLAGLRYLGHSFNPVSFYYCFDRAGERVEAVVADVNNIPWGERHAYVLGRGESEGPVLSEELDKTLHVSPLMGMDQTYSFRASEPGARLAVQIESRPRAEPGGRSFDATLSLRRRELSRPLLAAMLARYPAMSLQVVAKIYAQSLRLKLKGARYFPHPQGRRPKGFIAP